MDIKTPERKSLIAKLRANMAEHQRQVEEAKVDLGSIRKQIDALEDERQHLLSAPTTKQDFLLAICAMVDRYKLQGLSNMQSMLTRHFNRRDQHSSARMFSTDDFKWERIRSISAGERDFLPGAGIHFLVAGQPNTVHTSFTDNFSEISLCALFGDQIKESLKKTFDSVEWPYPEALPTAHRVKRLDAIANELQGLHAEEADLSALIAG